MSNNGSAIDFSMPDYIVYLSTTEEETLRFIKPDYVASWTLICAFFVLVFNFVLLETLV